MGRPTVHVELVADSRSARDLGTGKVFIHDCELAVNEHCELVVATAVGELRLDARVDYIDGKGGAGLQIVGFGAELKASLAAFIGDAAKQPGGASHGIEDLDDAVDTLDMDASGLATHASLGNAPPYLHGGGLDDDVHLDEPTIRRPSISARGTRNSGLVVPAVTDDGRTTHEDIRAELREPDHANDDLRIAHDDVVAESRTQSATWGADETVRATHDLAEARTQSASWASDETVRATPDVLEPRTVSATWKGADDTVRASADLVLDDDQPTDDADEHVRSSDNGHGPDEDVRAPDRAAELEQALSTGTEDERRVARTMHERLRGLTVIEQHKKANSPDPSERIMLERLYGKTVWEALLRNPRLTPPEVARLARMGTLPRPMLELIVGNGSWLQVPEVRRALLSNPRLGTDQILRVLRLLPKHELKVASTATVYPYAVRDAAKRLVRST